MQNRKKTTWYINNDWKTTMLKTFDFFNYKAFEAGKIDIKPITIILGANSSGKSSILQLILLFLQTCLVEDEYDNALKMNGRFVSLGEAENIFRNKELKKPIRFDFSCSSTSPYILQIELKRFKSNIENDIYYLYRKFHRLYIDYCRRMNKNIDDIGHLSPRGDLKPIFKAIKKIQKYLVEGIDTEPKVIQGIFEDEPWSNGGPQKPDEIKRLINTELKEIETAYSLVNSFANLRFRNYTMSWQIAYSQKEKKLVVENLSIFLYEDELPGQKLLEYKVLKGKGQQKKLLKSEILDAKILEKFRVIFGKNSVFNTLFLFPKAGNGLTSQFRIRRNPITAKSFVLDTIFNIFGLFSHHFKKNFSPDRINYISPLRAFPKRYYFLDKANISSSLDSIDGDNLTEVLKQNKELKRKVNDWLKAFNLSINIEDLKDVIHKIKVHQHGINFDITDVGFGISQVLPVIVQGFLSPKKSVTLIEQPEIHLHPKMQAQLADLFIDVVNSDGQNDKALIIETHSEYLLKRLRRRIAEKKISCDDVALYFIHDREKKLGSAKVEMIPISATGSFNWPSEFYSTEYEDTAEFMKLQG